MSKVAMRVSDQMSVYPGEIARFFKITEQQARNFFRRGWILAEGDFKSACKVGKLWRGSLTEWECVKRNFTKN